jgi:hypothetical protein
MYSQFFIPIFLIELQVIGAIRKFKVGIPFPLTPPPSFATNLQSIPPNHHHHPLPSIFETQHQIIITILQSTFFFFKTN